MKYIKIMAVVSIALVAAMYAWNNLFVSEQKHEVPGFSAIHVTGPINVFLEKSTNQEVIVRADDNIHDQLEIFVENEVLMISNSKNINRERILDIYIKYSKLDSIHSSGASTVTSKNHVTTDNLKLFASGAAEMRLQVTSDSTYLIMDGAANVQLAGFTNYFDVEINHVGDMMAYNFEARNCNLRMHTGDQSPGVARINVTERLYASIKGPRLLKYKGNPTVIEDITGRGSIEQY